MATVQGDDDVPRVGPRPGGGGHAGQARRDRHRPCRPGGRRQQIGAQARPGEADLPACPVARQRDGPGALDRPTCETRAELVDRDPTVGDTRRRRDAAGCQVGPGDLFGLEPRLYDRRRGRPGQPPRNPDRPTYRRGALQPGDDLSQVEVQPVLEPELRPRYAERDLAVERKPRLGSGHHDIANGDP